MQKGTIAMALEDIKIGKTIDEIEEGDSLSVTEVIELKDILVDDVRAVEIEEILKDILEDENSKFYIDFDGTYVIIGMGSLVRVDTILQNKIFKTEYILK